MKVIVVLCLTSLLIGCIGGVSSKESITDEFFQQRRKSMDIIDLIALLRQDYNLGDWQAFDNDRRFDWVHNGANGKDFYYHSYYSKNGTIHITMNGDFIHYDFAKHEEPTPWHITLAGGHGGFDKIVVDSRVMSNQFSGFEQYFTQKKVLVKAENLPCDPPYMGCGLTKMLLNIKGKIITVMEEEAGGGTAGPAYTLYMNTDGDADNIMPKKEDPSKPATLKQAKRK